MDRDKLKSILKGYNELRSSYAIAMIEYNNRKTNLGCKSPTFEEPTGNGIKKSEVELIQEADEILAKAETLKTKLNMLDNLMLALCPCDREIVRLNLIDNLTIEQVSERLDFANRTIVGRTKESLQRMCDVYNSINRNTKGVLD